MLHKCSHLVEVSFERSKTNPRVSIVKDGIIVLHECISYNPIVLCEPIITDNAPEAAAHRTRQSADDETIGSHGERKDTDVECNGWRLCITRDGIVAISNKAGGIPGSWNTLIEVLDIGGGTDDDGHALIKTR